MNAAAWFALGVFIGCAIGVLASAMCVMAADGREAE